MNTIAQTIKAAFKELLLAEKTMKANSGTDAYYEAENVLKALLLTFMRCDFSVLTTAQLLKLCALVSSHRPCALHTFLIYCSNLSDKVNP